MSVGRANSILSIKTARTEAVKGGLRLALADSTRLYDTCGPPARWRQHGDPHLLLRHRCPSRDQLLLHRPGALARRHRGQVRTRGRAGGPDRACRDDQLRIRVAEPDIDERMDRRHVVDVHDRQDLAARTCRRTVCRPGRRSDGRCRPSSCPTAWPTCTVYFPGTYPNPVTLDGPTYFTSGHLLLRGHGDSSRAAPTWSSAPAAVSTKVAQRSARGLLRRQRAVDAQHQRPRGHVRVRRSRPSGGRQRRRSGRSRCGSTSDTLRPATTRRGAVGGRVHLVRERQVGRRRDHG